MLQIEKKRGTGELLPRLEKILQGRGVSLSRINAGNAHAGWVSRGAVFVAKSKIWKNQVSAQKEIIDKCILHGRWLCFWIPGTGMLKFDPSRIIEKGWRNMRDSEEMVNIDIKYGSFASGDNLDMEPIRKVEQLSMLGESQKTKEVIEHPPREVNNIITQDSPTVAELKSWRQKLGIVMTEYAKRFQIPLWQVEGQIYKKYAVGSRTELSSDELRAEYLSYKTALDQAIA